MCAVKPDLALAQAVDGRHSWWQANYDVQEATAQRSKSLVTTVNKQRPDYLVRLANQSMLVLEVRGRLTEQDKAKHAALDEWVTAVNAHGDLGSWRWAVSFNPADLEGLLAQQ